MDDLKLWGPPGTGKTTRGIVWLQERIDEGADLRRSAFVSFTNAAVNEARGRIAERFGVESPEEELPYCRTLHSLAKRALGVNDRDWHADAHLQEFADTHGYDLKPAKQTPGDEDLEAVAARSGRDAVNLQVWDFARQRLHEDPEDGWESFVDYDPDGVAFASRPRFLAFVADYEQWKRDSGLRDYTDLLTEFLAEGLPLAASVVVTDESQDLSPLMFAVADRMFAEAEFRATLGDDDQAIYGYSGADPSLMNSRKARHQIKLRQSYRLPRRVAEVAREIIGQNENREPKDFEARDAEGRAERAYWLQDLELLNGESWFGLVRNWKLLEQIVPELEESGIPYRIAGGKRYSPWSDRGPIRAVRAILKLAEGQDVTFGELWPLAQKSSSQRGADKPGAWTWGSKKRLEERYLAAPGALLSWRDLIPLGMTVEGFRQVMSRNLSILSREISDRDRDCYKNALREGTLTRPVTLTLSSIHGVKGQEADSVFTLMGCTGAPYRALLKPWRLEEERRVSYVGATRARNSLFGLMASPAHGVYPWELMGI